MGRITFCRGAEGFVGRRLADEDVRRKRAKVRELAISSLLW